MNEKKKPFITMHWFFILFTYPKVQLAKRKDQWWEKINYS